MPRTITLHALNGRYYASEAEAALTAKVVVDEGRTAHQQTVHVPTEPTALADWLNRLQGE